MIGNTSNDAAVSHPGRYIHEELYYMGGDTNANRDRMAECLHISRKVLDGLFNGEVDIDVNLAVQLHEAFGPSAQYYLNLQQEYDILMNGVR